MNFSIGDICFGIDDAVARAQQSHVFSFTTDRSPGVQCTLTDELPRAGSCLFHSGLTWRLHDAENGYLLCMHRGQNEEVYQQVWLSDDFSHARLNTSFAATPEASSFFSMDGALFQLWASFLLNRSRGILLHTLAVKKDDRAYLFPGKSGVGKTTLARLIAEANAGEILSDDRAILRWDGDTYRVYGTPWNGEMQYHRADDAPLKAIYFPEQSPDCTLDVMPVAQAASHLFASSSLAGWPLGDAMGFVLNTTASIAESTKSYRLGFTPDRAALGILGWL